MNETPGRLSALEPPHGYGADWPMREWLLALLGAAAGLSFYFLVKGPENVPWRMALATFVVAAPLTAGLTLEPRRWQESALFSALAGAVLAGLAWHVVRSEGHVAAGEFAFAAGVVAALITIPLFQAGFHRTRWATPYRDLHYFAWTDAISGAGALAFTGLAWAALALLSALFQLLKINVLSELMNQDWFGPTYSGLAFGAALGRLRNQLATLGTLQGIVALVLSLLAVPLAVGLVVFLGAMIVSGPQVLWEATRSATPVLLACAAGAFLLANAVIRDDDVDITGNRLVRLAGLVLALAILPLTFFAAISLGTRIAQYGLSPERLWGIVAIAVAVLWGAAYWLAVIRGRRTGWTARLREANMHLALVVSAIALFLALPILDFGSIAARSQAARLTSGKVAPGKFDFDALRWDFGDGGRRVLARLQRSPDASVARLAREAAERTQRPIFQAPSAEQRDDMAAKARFRFDDPQLRRWALDHLAANPWFCQPACLVFDMGQAPRGHEVAFVTANMVHRARFDRQGRPVAPPPQPASPEILDPRALDGRVEQRTQTVTRFFVDGRELPEAR